MILKNSTVKLSSKIVSMSNLDHRDIKYTDDTDNSVIMPLSVIVSLYDFAKFEYERKMAPGNMTWDEWVENEISKSK